MTVVRTDRGRVVSGIIVEHTRQRLTMQTVDQRVVVAAADIDKMKTSPVSIMPAGQLEQLDNDSVRDLVAYLASTTQVPLGRRKNVNKQR